MASTPFALLSKRAQEALGGAEKIELTPKQQELREFVRSRVPAGTRIKDLLLEFPKVYLNGREIVGGRRFARWRELSLMLDPEEKV